MAAASLAVDVHETSNARMVQNYFLVWLHGGIDKINKDDCHQSIMKLQEVVNTINEFVDEDECINFITEDNEEKIFMVISEPFSPIIIPVVQDISQVSCVYIHCQNEASHENWTKSCSKVKGVYTDIPLIGEALKQAIQECDQNSISISFVKTTDESSNPNLNQLDQSFMYTQIMKEILLTIDFEQEHFDEFIKYCRKQFANNVTQLKNVDRIEKEYTQQQPIWCYTYNCFLYSMLNRALRTMEIDLIVKMGFFIRDLHNQITTLHSEQYGEHHHFQSFTVYRGQGLSHIDFDQLKKTQVGLLSFNQFLSTSEIRDVSLKFTKDIIATPGLVGVLFTIQIDPSVSATPFANIRNVSYYRKEEEILWSMHSIFRIAQIASIDKNDRLWQVNLTLTSENDPQLHVLTEYIRKETLPDAKGWHRLSHLMIKLGQYGEAKELCDLLLTKSTCEKEKASVLSRLGRITEQQGKYAEAVAVYQKALEIDQKTLPPNHPELAIFYNNIGLVYDSMGEYSKALSNYEKSLEIDQKTLPPNHPGLATSYNNIGLVYYNMGEYSKALSNYEKSLQMRQKTLPSNHPDLATSYNNMVLVYYKMGEYSKALSNYEKSLQMRQKTLPSNHPDLATSYNNIGSVYNNMGEYSKALSNYEKSLKILQKTLPPNHPNLASSYNNIGSVYNNMGEYSKALSNYEKSFEIDQKTLPPNHPNLGNSYNNIGLVYDSMGEYSKALSNYEKAFEILQNTLPPNHPNLGNSYNNIGSVYDDMGEYSKALSNYEKSFEIQQKTLPPNHSDLATSYSNIGLVYHKMGEYSKALSNYEKSFEIRQKTLPPNHPNLATTYNNIGLVYNNMDEYSKALSNYEKALEILQKTLPPYHPDLAISYKNIGMVYGNMGEYSKALSYCELALNIWAHSLPPNHVYIKNVKTNIELIKRNM